MRVIFWGSRGSLPFALNAAALKTKLVRALTAAAGRNLDTEEKARVFIDNDLDFSVSHTFGGNTPCVEIQAGSGEYVLCDLGSGVREFGIAALARHGTKSPQTYHVFMSHVHWDHIMGFPFFLPAYLPGNRVVIYGCHDVIESALRRQQDEPCFPVSFDKLGANIEFVALDPHSTSNAAGFRVTPLRQFHSGDSYGFRFERDGKVLVYSTDAEHKLDDPRASDEFVDFLRDADLVIFDAMYSFADSVSVKEDWGHSSNVVAVELCQRANAKHLCLFHHEPAFDDERITRIWRETQRLEEITRLGEPLKVSAAYDGLVIDF
jgi:phosphoribosyl 1,2-cyclic phosphodiesterase